MKQIFAPFGRITRPTFWIIATVQLVLALVFWHFTSTGLIPRPGTVVKSLGKFLGTKSLYDEVLVSLGLTLKAMFYAILITLFFAYLSVMPFFKSIALFIVKLRYLTLTGLIFIFTLLTRDGSELKLSLLIFGIVPFFVTSFLSVIANIDRQQYELCQTLGYNKWETLYEVIIVGKADQVFEIVRQNFAIAWLMITYVESLSLSEGGIGALMYKYNRYNDLANVIALQIVIFVLGLFFDYLLGFLRLWLFPHTKLQLQQ